MQHLPDCFQHSSLSAASLVEVSVYFSAQAAACSGVAEQVAAVMVQQSALAATLHAAVLAQHTQALPQTTVLLCANLYHLNVLYLDRA